MLTPADLAQMTADLSEVRLDNETIITIRRGDNTLTPQSVRIVGNATGQTKDGEAAQEVRGKVVVLGATNLDIQPGDRFNDAAGELYNVTFVRPNRTVATEAEAEVVE